MSTKISLDRLKSFIATSQGMGGTAVLRGTLFERHAHTILANGGKFEIRSLEPGNGYDNDEMVVSEFDVDNGGDEENEYDNNLRHKLNRYILNSFHSF